MKATMRLPEGYRLLQEIDLEKNKKQYILVNVLSIVIAVVFFIPMLLLAPEGAEFIRGIFELLLLLAGMFGYIVLHEAVHGVCFWGFSRQKPRFGFKSVYAYAASDAYYPKGAYLVIGLSPVVLWGVALAVLHAG